MSSISAQGVVERASAELTKRINGLGLRTSKHHGSGKASVMERVTNVFSGSGGVAYTNLQSANNTNATPEKPSRSAAALTNNVPAANNKTVNNWTPSRLAIARHTSWEQLMLDEQFLRKFFLYFTATDRRVLAQVCSKWRDLLYSKPWLWFGLVPVVRCREVRAMPASSRAALYASFTRRCFRSLVLLGACDEDIPGLTDGFPTARRYVTSLHLRCCAITDRGLEALLNHLKPLFELELTGCNEITEAGLWKLTPKITTLSLSDCINVSDEAVGVVVQKLPNLFVFSLQAYHVTDAALDYFNNGRQKHPLSILRLQSCWELTNHGILTIVRSMPHLVDLSLSGCSKVTDDGVELIAANLTRLHCLDLSWCSRITDLALEYISSDLKLLRELKLDRCVHITDLGVGYISTMGSLDTLFLRWCSQLRDFGLQQLCLMRSLQVLSVAGCPLLTSSGLSGLIQLRHIRELELTNCPGTSRELFDYLREHLPQCLIIE